VSRLVGSEMCIRDRVKPAIGYTTGGVPTRSNELEMAGGELIAPPNAPVSGKGLDISKMSPQQLIELANSDPEAFASGVKRFKASQGDGGGVLPAQMPGQVPYMDSKAKAAADRTTELVKTAQEAPQRIAVLDKIIGLSRAGVGTGPTSEFKNNIKGIAADVFGIKTWKDDVTGYQEITKYMNQNAIRAWQAAGGSGTDSQLEAQTKANIRAGLYPEAVMALAQYAKAGELALSSKVKAAAGANLSTPQAQSQFEENWRAALDPRVYQIKVMAPAEAQAYVSDLKKNNPQAYQSVLASTMRLKELGGF
jgi:hypothetical protein